MASVFQPQKIPHRIRELRDQGKPSLSIEIFPPKTEKGHANLKKRLHLFKDNGPDFISVTYGAGGSTRRSTLELAKYIQDDVGVTSMAHLTCVGQNSDEISKLLNQLSESKIQNLMLLRGDPPEGSEVFTQTEGGFSHGNELIEFAKSSSHGFAIGCAGYPEGHIEADSLVRDLDALKQKRDAGADFVVTQFFLDNVYFYRYLDQLEKHGIDLPVIAGILPIANTSQISRFAFMCGCTIPAKVMRGLHGKSDSDQEKFGLDHAASQVEELLSHRIDGVHLYALNKQSAVERLAPLVSAKR